MAADPKLLVLAVDIERTGASKREQTFAIGASVVNASYTELDSLLLAIWPEGEVQWEERCWNEFWSKNQNILDKLKAEAAKQQTSTKRVGLKALEAGMIRDLVEFIAKHQSAAKEQGLKLLITTDNAAFDFHWINHLIGKHLQGQYNPLPYRFDNQRYGDVADMSNEMAGMKRVLQAAAVKNGMHEMVLPHGYMQAMASKQHDHMPDNDAFTIAVKQQLCRQHLPALIQTSIERCVLSECGGAAVSKSEKCAGNRKKVSTLENCEVFGTASEK
jgi:hypothetical protein